MKLCAGIGSAILGWLLAWGGYNGAVAIQQDSAITAMVIIAVVVSILINLVAFVLLLFWNLEKHQTEVVAFIKEQNNRL